MRKKSSWILSASLLSLLTSCTSVQKLNVPVCTEISPIEGYCVNIIDGQDFSVTDDKTLEGDTWWQQRHRMIMVPPSSWAKIKSFIIEECKKNNRCSELSKWERTIDAIDKKATSSPP